MLFLAICQRLLETPFWSFNGSRLMPSIALARGVNYYVVFPPGGALYTTSYGPVMAIVYLPATLLSSPNSAVLLGAAITMLLCFAAMALLHFAPFHYSAADVLAFLTAGYLIIYLEPLKYACFNICADGPGLAFSAAACGVLYPGVREKWRAALPVSAVCAVLAIFSKQMFLPVPAVLLAWLWFVDGRRRAVPYLAWLIVAGGLAGAAALIAVGPQRLYHCLIWVPAHCPWYPPSHLVSFIQSARNFIRLSMPVSVVLLACLIYALPGADLRAWARSRSVPLLLSGVALLPFSIAGRAKVGGDINSFSFALFFLTGGLTVMLADFYRQSQPSTRCLAVPVLVAILLPLAISEAPLALDIRAKIRQLPQAGQQVALDYLRRHPGEAYFPWFPLSHYYAEHEFRHWNFGVLDRLLSGEALTVADYRAYMPRDPRVIAFGSDGTPEAFGINLMKFLPEYSRPAKEPELPGWQAYAKALP